MTKELELEMTRRAELIARRLEAVAAFLPCLPTRADGVQIMAALRYAEAMAEGKNPYAGAIVAITANPK